MPGILASLIAVFALLATPAPAAPKWTCGEWTKDSSGKCEEKRTCTRQVCDAKGDSITNCRTETRTECSNPAPKPSPKAGATRCGGQTHRPEGERKATTGDGRLSGPKTIGGSGSPTDGGAQRSAAQPIPPLGAPPLGSGGLGLSRETCEAFGGSTHGPGDVWMCCFELGGPDGMCYACRGETPGGGENCDCYSGACKSSLSDPGRHGLGPSEHGRAIERQGVPRPGYESERSGPRDPDRPRRDYRDQPDPDPDRRKADERDRPRRDYRKQPEPQPDWPTVQ